MGTPVGLIAGTGDFPLRVARAARREGRSLVAVGLRGLVDERLSDEVDRYHPLYVGELGALFTTFREAGVETVVMAGKVPKQLLAQSPGDLHLDARALELIRSLADRKDDSILGAIADALEAEGFALGPQMLFTPELWAEEGVLGAQTPTTAQARDVAFGFPIAKALGELDIGQTVVVQDRAVLALEAIEGTDAAIRRGCGLGRPGACVVKVAKPRQDPRFDVPAVGVDTLNGLVEGQASVLAVEAGRTIVLDREAVLREADARGIVLLGVAAERLPGEDAS